MRVAQEGTSVAINSTAHAEQAEEALNEIERSK